MADELLSPGPVTPEPAPAPADPFAKYLEGIPEALHETARQVLAAAHGDWETGATTKFQAAADAQRLRDSLKTNPKGTLAYLGEALGVTVRFDDELPAAPLSGPQRQDATAYESEVSRLQNEFEGATTAKAQWDVMRRLSTLEARKTAAEGVGDIKRAQIELQEQAALERAEALYPDINIRNLWPQIKRRQDAVAKRPYLFPDEAMAIELFPNTVKELRRVKGLLARGSADGDRGRAAVAGPSGGAPAASPDPSTMTPDQLMAAMGMPRER